MFSCPFLHVHQSAKPDVQMCCVCKQALVWGNTDVRVPVGRKLGAAQRQQGEMEMSEAWPLSLSTNSLPVLPDTKRLR